MVSGECKVNLLGGLNVTVDGVYIGKFQTQKTAALFAYLALKPGHRFLRESVGSILWPDGDTVAIRNRLNQAVSSVRRHFEAYGISPIISDNMSLSIPENLFQIDVEEFERELASADSAESKEIRRDHLYRAIEAYNGEFLDGLSDEWISPLRIRYTDLYVRALTELLKLSVELRDLDLAINIAQRRLTVDPLDERSHRSLMKLYLMVGRPETAIAQFETLENYLKLEGLRPSRRSVDLLAEAKSASQASPDEFDETIDQLVGKVVKQQSAAIQRKVNLPKMPAKFYGRTKEIEQIKDSIAGHSRLITLMGMGGSGKTHLAIEAAWRLAEQFDSKVGFVNLVDVVKPSEFQSKLREGFAMQGANSNQDLTQAASSIGPCLLILDNAEDLDRGSRQAIGEVLGQLPEVTFLVTSREPMDLIGERILTIGSLEGDSYEMFMDRASAVNPSFPKTPEVSLIVEEICNLLEGWPLAIELTAGWARSLSPSEMLKQLHRDWERFLVSRGGNDRHSSITAVIRSTIDKLPLDTLALFEKLCHFKGGWTHESATFMCPEEDALFHLDELERRSLIQSEIVNGETRFRCLAVISRYVWEQCSIEAQGQAIASQEEFLLTFAERNWRNTLVMRTELTNFDAMINRSLDSGNCLKALDLLNLLSYSSLSLNNSATKLAQYEKARECCGALGDLRRAKTYLGSAFLHFAQADFSQTSEIREAIDLFEAEKNVDFLLWSKFLLAISMFRDEDPSEAQSLLHEIRNSAQQIGDQVLVVRCLVGQGYLAATRRNLENAEETHRLALSYATHLHDPYLHLTVLSWLVDTLILSGRSVEARELIDKMARTIEEHDAHEFYARYYLRLAQLERLDSNLGSALQAIRNLTHFRTQSEWDWENIIVVHASILCEVEQYELAGKLLGSVGLVGDRAPQLQLRRGWEPYLQCFDKAQAFPSWESAIKEGAHLTPLEAVRLSLMRTRELEPVS